MQYRYNNIPTLYYYTHAVWSVVQFVCFTCNGVLLSGISQDYSTSETISHHLQHTQLLYTIFLCILITITSRFGDMY